MHIFSDRHLNLKRSPVKPGMTTRKSGDEGKGKPGMTGHLHRSKKYRSAKSKAILAGTVQLTTNRQLQQLMKTAIRDYFLTNFHLQLSLCGLYRARVGVLSAADVST